MMIMVMMMIIALLVTPGSKDDDYDDINCAAEVTSLITEEMTILKR